MGLGIAALIGVALCFVALATKRSYLLYGLLFLISFFTEIGPGFSSFTGSWVFNQDFVGFFNFKLIEIVTAITYGFVLINYKTSNPPLVHFERKLCIALYLLLAVELFIEFWYHNTVTVFGWRLSITGVLLFHMIYILIDSEKEVILFVKALILALAMSALIGLIALSLGYGLNSPRGMVPFFWDTNQVVAFTFGIILLTAYLANYSLIPANGRMFSRITAIILLAILAITVLLSIRRAAWFIAIAGVFVIMLASKSVKVQHWIGASLALLIILIAIITVPAFDNFRDKISYYGESMNVFETNVAEQQKNASHIDNILQYSRIIMETPEIFLLGFRARPGDDYLRFEGGEYGLGTAHNGILRTVLAFGVLGTIIYLLFFFAAFMQYRQIKRLPSISPTRYIAVASITFLAVSFLPPLVFTPPFNSNIKGYFFTFTAIFLLRASIYWASKNAATPEHSKSVIGNKLPFQ